MLMTVLMVGVGCVVVGGGCGTCGWCLVGGVRDCVWVFVCGGCVDSVVVLIVCGWIWVVVVGVVGCDGVDGVVVVCGGCG